MKKSLYVVILMAVMTLSMVEAISNGRAGHMKLLAVTELPKGYIGSSADLYLDIAPGSGRVFIDTYPLTKVDTQMSTRFAREMACDFLDIDCSDLDFFYTIRAQSAIIGGPSAGAALTVLTISVLDENKIDERVAMTGTINSGGLVGPVSGLKGKIDAASAVGLTKVLIPYGQRMVGEEDDRGVINLTDAQYLNIANKSIDLIQYGKSKNVEVVEVSNLYEAMIAFTGKNFSKPTTPPKASSSYDSIMGDIAQDLCKRSQKLQEKIGGTGVMNNNSNMEKGLNLTDKGISATKEKRYYSAASFCFGANIQFSYLALQRLNLTMEQRTKRLDQLSDQISKFDSEITKRGYTTITDLETYMVVKERVVEATAYINQSRNMLNNTEESIYALAYALERYESAKSWNRFYGVPGKKFVINVETLKASCIGKMAEAEERYQYANIIVPTILGKIKEGIEQAERYFEEKNYELCIYQASKAKAEADVIINAMGVQEDQINTVMAQKTQIISDAISQKEEEGIFPLVGYSYYEYAQSLSVDDKYSTLLYLEYALELSNLDIYFKKPAKHIDISEGVKMHITSFIYGAVFGISICGLVTMYVIRRGKKDLKIRRQPNKTRKRGTR